MTLLRAISRSFTPLDSWIGRPFRIQKSRRTKKITRAFNVPCFRVKVAKAKRARGFRIDHSAGPNWPLCLRNNKRIAITPLIIEQSAFDTDSWRQARKTYRISKNSLIFFSYEAKCGHAFYGIRPDQIPFEVFVSARVRPRRSSPDSGTHFPQPD